MLESKGVVCGGDMWFPLLGGAERTLGEESEALGLVLPRQVIFHFCR